MPMTRPTGKLDEHAFNREFARVLAETDARWLAHADEYILAEWTGTLDRGRADVLIDDPGMPAAAVETSFDSVDADRDARKRLGRRTARGGRELLASLAVHIPGECRDVPADAVRASLRDGSQQIGYALHQKGWSGGSRRRWPASGFIRGTVHDASRLIAEAAMPKEVADARADRVALLVKQAAAALRSKLHDRTQREIAGVVGQHSPLEGLRTTMVLWLNALLIQQRLHVQGVRGIPPVRTVLGVRPDPFEQVEVWRRMAEIRRQSVYQPGVRALAACGDLHRAGTIETLTQSDRGGGCDRRCGFGPSHKRGGGFVSQACFRSKGKRRVLHPARDGGTACGPDNSEIGQAGLRVGEIRLVAPGDHCGLGLWHGRTPEGGLLSRADSA